MVVSLRDNGSGLHFGNVNFRWAPSPEAAAPGDSPGTGALGCLGGLKKWREVRVHYKRVHYKMAAALENLRAHQVGKW